MSLQCLPIVLSNVDSSTKACPTLNEQNAKLLTTLGKLCDALGRPPASAVISTGLVFRTAPFTSGALTDVWSGRHDNEQVAIKVFRAYHDATMREVKKVCIECVQ